LDLAEICGLPLRRFQAFVLNLGSIPACWSSMTGLEYFYCSNCMMTRAPTAMRGFKALRSFVAFRQSEMIPCALHHLPANRSACKPSWETRAVSKAGNRRESTGHFGDFQTGPSYLCPESSYAFPFEDLVNLQWTNVKKVWLDGNFLTGTIPSDIATSWPALQSLDLYDNLLTGTIPESLGTLPLVKLQLHANNFSGVVPDNIFERWQTAPMVLGLSSNPLLGGCVPAGPRHRPPIPFETNITYCETFRKEL
jgi:hypothetical protein